MKYNIFSYLIGEGFKNTMKNKKSTFAALSIMIATMIIFGVFLAIIENIDSFLTELEHSQAIQVFMTVDTPQEQIDKLRNDISNLDGVNSVQFVSEEDAVNIMKDYFENNEKLLAGAEDIFPPSFLVNFSDLTKSEEVQSQIINMEGVSTIQNSNETTSALLGVGNAIRLISAIILVFLIVVSLFIISNTIKLTVHARRKEISIMKYIGATNNFIRSPFIVEGIIIGIVAAMISVLLIGLSYNIIAEKLLTASITELITFQLLGFNELFNLIIVVYLVLGVGVGVIGSMISMRRYLKV